MELGDLRKNLLQNHRVEEVAILAIMELGDLLIIALLIIIVILCRNPRYNGIG